MRLNELTVVGKYLTSNSRTFNFGDKTKVNFTLMVPSAGDKNEETGYYDSGFFDVEAWGESAAFIEGLDDKTEIKISGYLKQHKWVDKVTNGNRYKICINASKIELVESDITPEPKGKGRNAPVRNRDAETSDTFDPFAADPFDQ